MTSLLFFSVPALQPSSLSGERRWCHIYQFHLVMDDEQLTSLCTSTGREAAEMSVHEIKSGFKHATSLGTALSFLGLPHYAWRQRYRHGAPSTTTSLSILAPRDSVGMCLSWSWSSVLRFVNAWTVGGILHQNCNSAVPCGLTSCF